MHVARELEREGFRVPLLIGGATTSRAHTAVKIAPAYGQPVVHVADASRAVGVVSMLKSIDQRTAFADENRREQERTREQYRGPRVTQLLSIDEARRRKPAIDWRKYEPPVPSFTGTRTWECVPLGKLVPYIDWTPFFHTWELKGVYPRASSKTKPSARAPKSCSTTHASSSMKLSPRNPLSPRAPSCRHCSRRIALATTLKSMPTPHALSPIALRSARCVNRWKNPKANPSMPWPISSRQKETGLADYLGGFACHRRHRRKRASRALRKAVLDDYNAIMAKALADRLAEALAEWLHKEIRDAWGFGRDENLKVDDLLREHYRGIRPAPGYPASPDHTEKTTLFALLDAHRATGIELTENFAMLPAASICGLYFSHPDSRYFAVGKIGRDQVLDYHRRKGLDLREVERWLSSQPKLRPPDRLSAESSAAIAALSPTQQQQHNARCHREPAVHRPTEFDLS